jgi:FeoC like transcriptional regulator
MATAVAFSVEEYTSKYHRMCECGHAKKPGAAACDRCLFLDGRFSAEVRVIAHLRGTAEASMTEMTRELAMDYRQLHRLLDRLIAIGHVAKRSETTSHDPDERASYVLHRDRIVITKRCLYRLCGEGA